MLKQLTAILLPLTASLAWAQAGDAILGTWLTTDEDGNQDSIVEIIRDGGTYAGVVRWVRFRTYPDDDPMAGQPLVDRSNPDPDQRGMPVVGLAVLRDLHYDDGMWRDGTTYSVRSGKTYRVRISLPEHNRLKLRGYIGSPFLGKTVYWNRSPIPTPEPAASP